MQANQTFLRMAATTTATVFMVMGAGGPVTAAVVRGDNSASAQGAQQSEANQAAPAQSESKPPPAESMPPQSQGQPGEQGQAASAQGQGGSSAPAAQAQANQGKANQAPGKSGAKPAGNPGKGNGPKSPDKPATAQGAGQGQGEADKHTVCHRSADGGVKLLTVGGKALDAHLGHGDVEPVDGTCPDSDRPDRDGGNGTGHIPVTVCHLLGNGSYILLTFDVHALEAHMNHGDKAVPASGDCSDPAGSTGTTGSGLTSDGTTSGDEDETTTGAGQPVETVAVPSLAPEVLGVQQERGTPAAVELEAPGTLRPPKVFGPTGVLPATGAGDYLALFLAGLTLLAAGGALLARRRPQASR